jgi:hypothetical protein
MLHAHTVTMRTGQKGTIIRSPNSNIVNENICNSRNPTYIYSYS